MIIYKIENTINQKKYIGQTKNFKQRMRGHKSEAYNANSKSYCYLLQKDIRKYGWECFDKVILETLPDNCTQEYCDERERYYIELFRSSILEYGYNTVSGGKSKGTFPQKSYAQRLKLSNIFSCEEVKQIQEELRKGIKRKKIQQSHPNLTESFLDNINAGINFYNEDWEYPLHNYSNDISGEYSLEEIHEIKKDIASGLKYCDIKEKWKISIGLISLINNGKQWYEEDYAYPLISKPHSRKQNKETWVPLVKIDLKENVLSIKEIAQKYKKSIATIQKINKGSSYFEEKESYPLSQK